MTTRIIDIGTDRKPHVQDLEVYEMAELVGYPKARDIQTHDRNPNEERIVT